VAAAAVQVSAALAARWHPFDRMLVAQAQAEGLVLVTHDRRLQPYDVEILWT
jgi:PIN domain nuclease of toxin-antitoxin system